MFILLESGRAINSFNIDEIWIGSPSLLYCSWYVMLNTYRTCGCTNKEYVYRTCATEAEAKESKRSLIDMLNGVDKQEQEEQQDPEGEPIKVVTI